MLNNVVILISLAMIAAANAFQVSISQTIQKRSDTLPLPLPQHKNIIIKQTAKDEEEYEGEEFFVSQEQILSLRKEASKRESNRRLPKWVLPPEEAAEVSEDTIDKLIYLFNESEIIEVRGISRDKKKGVYDTAHGLAGLLEEEMSKPVVVVNIKGFAAKMYSPWEEDRGSNIQLRTSYRPGQWTKKPKPVRDNRGHIIIGEDGKNIKEIPE